MFLLGEPLRTAFPFCRDAVYVKVRDHAARSFGRRVSRVNEDDGFKIRANGKRSLRVNRVVDDNNKCIQVEIPMELLDDTERRMIRNSAEPTRLVKMAIGGMRLMGNMQDRRFTTYFHERLLDQAEEDTIIHLLESVAGRAENSPPVATGGAHDPIVVDDDEA